MLKSIYKYSLVLLISAYAYSGVNDYKSFNLIESKDLKVYSIDFQLLEFFDNATYDESKSRLEFITKHVIQSIQIYNSDNEIEFLLPVKSKKVFIQKSLFSTGHNRLGFNISGKSERFFTEVFIF